MILEVRPEVLRVPTAALREGNTVLRLGSDEVLGKYARFRPESPTGEFEITAGLEAGDRIVTSLEREGVGLGVARYPTNRWRTGAEAMAQIELEDIERIFHLGDTASNALSHVSLSIEAGEYVSVMGPSGSGKSTLLNLLGLLDRPDTGATGWRAATSPRSARTNGPGYAASASASYSRAFTWCRDSAPPRTSRCR